MAAMLGKSSLRSRIVQACVILTAIVCTVYALLLLAGIHALEDRLLNDRMLGSADDLIRNHVQHARAAVGGDPQVYQDDGIPAAMRELPVGEVQELELGDRVLHVLIRQQGGHRFAVVDDESDFERNEGRLWAALAGTSALCIALALALGAVTARRVILPLVHLANAVARNGLDKDPLALWRGDEVGVLARALAVHQDEMQRFLTREQLFTGDVSHELRTPLTVMLGAAEVLAARLPDRPDLLPFVERIRRNAVETGDRVSALLLLSRAPEHLEFPPVDLPHLLAHEVERCRPLLAGKPVSLQLLIEDPKAQAYGPPELVATAVGNLIRNACQFTEAGYVRVLLQQRCIVVEDSGSGIPQEIRRQVFERYVRASGRPAGSGLGLAIVQRVCEHLRWTITVQASISGGARFAMAFPAEPMVA
jgi:signal transduction histidine kinase